MQPWPSPRTGCANGDENRRRAQQPYLRASGDRLFFVKCAEGLAPKPYARDRSRMAETARQAGSVHESPLGKADVDHLSGAQKPTGQRLTDPSKQKRRSRATFDGIATGWLLARTDALACGAPVLAALYRATHSSHRDGIFGLCDRCCRDKANVPSANPAIAVEDGMRGVWPIVSCQGHHCRPRPDRLHNVSVLRTAISSSSQTIIGRGNTREPDPR